MRSKKQNPATMIVLLLLLALTSCSNAVEAAYFPGLQIADGPIATANPYASATPTPFMPNLPTATPVPAATATPTLTPTATLPLPWGSFAPPVEPSAIEIHAPAQPFEQEDNVVNIVILGSDQRPDDYGHRTDVMMIVSLDPNTNDVTMLSIPRDLYVYIPGWRVDRINTADAYGGSDMVRDTLLYNFGIEIDHWVELNFYGFTAAIDTLGGINVQSTANLYDECGGIWWSYGPGTYYMDGFQALCYVRMRKNSSDFDRLRREQEVVQAIFNRFASLDGLSRVPELYNQFQNYVQTDMTLEDFLPLIPMAATVATDTSHIHHYSVDPNMASLWRVPYSGSSVLLPNWERLNAMLAEAFGPD
ncbi:MAG: LCP family protein [Anaerolineales bacterium]|nr:LCP family protein [Anaerolineales bacterium]